MNIILPITSEIKGTLDTVLFAAQFLYMDYEQEDGTLEQNNDRLAIVDIRDRVAQIANSNLRGKIVALELTEKEVTLLLQTCDIINEESAYNVDSKIFKNYLLSHIEGMEDAAEQLNITDI
jgi:hypothetical protein